MAKYLNMNVSGVQTPLKISDVVTITVNAAGTATVLTDAGTGTATINIAAAGATVRPPSSVTQRALWLRGLWEQVVKGVAQPWNLPMVPSESVAWDLHHLHQHQLHQQQEQDLTLVNQLIQQDQHLLQVSNQLHY